MYNKFNASFKFFLVIFEDFLSGSTLSHIGLDQVDHFSAVTVCNPEARQVHRIAFLPFFIDKIKLAI